MSKTKYIQNYSLVKIYIQLSHSQLLNLQNQKCTKRHTHTNTQNREMKKKKGRVSQSKMQHMSKHMSKHILYFIFYKI